jgi:wyosine [tRNA(Phe)-imidazoG37] synthetase (radical SAM superfamily)
MKRLAYSIRTREFLKTSNTLQDSNYIKQIYLKNRNWNPPPASMSIEAKITDFEKKLKSAHRELIKRHNKSTLCNLTRPQLNILKSLKQNEDILIKPTDKNLGPAILQKGCICKTGSFRAPPLQ